VFEEQALREVAKEAIKQNTGARGLRSILEKIMLNIMYEIPDRLNVSKVIITPEVITEKKEPIYVEDTFLRSNEAVDSSNM